MANLKDKVVLVTGASRGIGQAIALRCAQDGAKVAVLAKTSEPHPKLIGTIHTTAKQIEEAGGEALPIQVDLRDEDALVNAVEQTVSHFGKLDCLVNNASALNMTPTLKTPAKRFDLMFGVNVRGTFLASQAAIPHLAKSDNPHILTISPPFNLSPKWFKNHLVYTMSKYGMSMCTLGMAAEFAEQGIAVNSLWPKTTIATAAIEVNFPKNFYDASRKPEIMADAAHFILTQDSKEFTGQFLLDEEALKSAGVEDFTKYAMNPDLPLIPDLYIGD